VKAEVSPTGPRHPAVLAQLPLLVATPGYWAEIAAANLPVFLADHAVCEQQAALFGLALVGQYPGDPDLVQKVAALAAEEVAHFRRVATILHKRGHQPAHRRVNPWVQALRGHMITDREPDLKVDRLCVGALIEARSCERFTCLLDALDDPEVERLLSDLGPAEARHWRLFHRLAARELPAEKFTRRWREWLEIEAELTGRCGKEPRVHG
jgi:tRNA-(ms[2]io[6]A)-hydroxylase